MKGLMSYASLCFRSGSVVLYIIALTLLSIQTACNKFKFLSNDKPTASFIFQKNCLTTSDSCQITFINQSTKADYYKWDFGDGQVSDVTNPVHMFSQNRDSFIVKLKAISLSSAIEEVQEQVVRIIEAPACENVGSFKCAGKLENNQPVRAKFDASHNINYYYFITPKAGVAKITLSPVPAGSSYSLSVLSEPRDNSPVLKTEYGDAGETIVLYAGPLDKDTFYIKADPPGNSGAEFYNLTYSFNNDDPNEINDMFSQATFLPFDVSMPGTILAANDLDYYRFYLSKPGAVDITVSPVPLFPNNNDLTLEVFNDASASSRVGSPVHGNPGETIKLSHGPLDTGSHYILLKSNGHESTDKYYLQIKADESDPNELNKSFTQATPVQNNVGVKATIKAIGDEDYYKYTALTNAIATVTIDKVPAGLLNMYVEVFKDANGSSRTDYTYANEGNSISFNTALSLVAGQTYYFHVYAYGNSRMSNEQYTFKVKQ